MKLKKRLRAKDLGDPKLSADFPAKDIKPLGVIFGVATGTWLQKDRSDETRVTHLLLGFFEGMPASGSEALRSDTLMLTGAAQAAIVAKVTAAVGAGHAVQFILQIGTRKAENSAGYEYVIDVIGKPELFDPLDTMRAIVKKIPKK